METTATLLLGGTLKIMWGWFIANQFHLPFLTTLQAYGLLMTVRLITNIPDFKSGETMAWGNLFKRIFKTAGFCGMVLGIGCIQGLSLRLRPYSIVGRCSKNEQTRRGSTGSRS